MNILLRNNLASMSVTFEHVTNIVLQPDKVVIYDLPPERDVFGDIVWEPIKPCAIIKSQETSGRRYWNYNGTWYSEFEISDLAQFIQLPLFEVAHK